MTKARTLAAAAVLFAAASPLSAQSGNAWSAWYGCWHAVGTPANERLCIDPEGDGVRMTSVVDGQARGETRVVADNRARDVVQDECRGTERARWSNDRRRVFLNADMNCNEGRRSSSGIIAFTDPSHWVSVQAVSYDGETSTRRTLYEAIDAPAVLARDVRAWAASSVSQSDADEAARYVDDAAVQEWLNASESDYASNGSTLDMLNRGGTRTVVVDRPVYVDRRVYVEPYTRYVSCWDPFWGGYFGITRHVGVVVNYGCGYRYYRPYVVRSYPRYEYHRPTLIIHRDSYRDRDYHRDRDRDSYRDRDRDRERDRDRDRQRDDGSRVTRGGYTQNREAVQRAPQTTNERTRVVTRTSTSDNHSSSGSDSNSGRTARRRN